MAARQSPGSATSRRNRAARGRGSPGDPHRRPISHEHHRWQRGETRPCRHAHCARGSPAVSSSRSSPSNGPCRSASSNRERPSPRPSRDRPVPWGPRRAASPVRPSPRADRVRRACNRRHPFRTRHPAPSPALHPSSGRRRAGGTSTVARRRHAPTSPPAPAGRCPGNRRAPASRRDGGTRRAPHHCGRVVRAADPPVR